MAEEYDVEAGHLLGHGLSGVLVVVGSMDAAIQSGVEESEDEVGLLVFFDVLHPLTGTLGHFLELHALPHLAIQPLWYGGRQHTDDADFYTVTYVDGVGLQARIDVFVPGRAVLRTLLDDVGTQQGASHLSDPFVVDLVAWFDIMVAYGFGIVLHIVDHTCRQVLVFRHDVVRPVDAGLSLQDVAVVNEQQPVAIILSLFSYIGICA